MARKTGRRRAYAEEIVALAKAMRAEIDSYNRANPTRPFSITDAVSRIIENDPDYVPRRGRAAGKKRQPTTNPGIFTVSGIAQTLGTTTGTLLREKGFEVTQSDLRTFRWVFDFLRMRFAFEASSAGVMPDARSFVAKDFTFPHPLVVTKIPQKGEIAAGKTGRENDFEIAEAEIVGSLNNPALVTAVVKGRSMVDRFREGDTIVIDTSRRTPRQHEPVAVNVENEGGILGYWRAEAGSYYLDKHNTDDFGPVKLPHPSEWTVIGVVTLVQSPVRRQDRPLQKR
jgi:SOS-response transcriptional repressor LexA